MAIQDCEGSEHCRNKYVTNISSLSYMYVEKLSDTGSLAVTRWTSLWVHVYVSTFMSTSGSGEKILDLNTCR